MPAALPTLVDELLELARASGRPNLYLDLANVTLPVDILVNKFIELNEKLQSAGHRLVLTNAAPPLANLFRAEGETSVTIQGGHPNGTDQDHPGSRST